MKKNQKWISFILLAVLLTSCGNTAEETISENRPENTVTETETTDPYLDDLPADLTFAGESVTFLYREEVSSEFFAEGANGEVVNDAIFNSICDVEDRLNVDINIVLRPGHYTDVRQNYKDHIQNTVFSGDAVYDWCDMMVASPAGMMSLGIFMNLLENPYIDIEKPYYMKGFSDLSIDGKLYEISGDASLGYLKCTDMLYFNQQLAENYHIPNLYSLVDEGKWTLDKMQEIAKMTSEDVNNDGKYNMNDQLGFILHDSNHLFGFVASTKMSCYNKVNDIMQFQGGNDLNISVMEKLHTLLYGGAGVYFPNITSAVPDMQDDYYAIADHFKAGNVFMMSAEFDDVVVLLRDMEDPYGILPFPKYDEAQDAYYSMSRSTHNCFVMPTTTKQPEIAGAVLEALSSTKYETVSPAYFEVALKTKYSYDSDSARMYDIIHNSVIIDFGYVYHTGLGSVWPNMFPEAVKKGNPTSVVASYRKKGETMLQQFIDDITALDS